MTQTRIADNVAWHLHKELKKVKKDSTGSRIDRKFNEWAKRNNVPLTDIPLMRKTK